MALRKRVDMLDKKTGKRNSLPFLLIFTHEGDDEEQAIVREIAKTGRNREECKLIIVTFVTPKHRDIVNDYQNTN